jgi:carbon monoxide dehydrogenase subunit G
MQAFESQVHIDRPVQAVWRELTDWVWLPEVVRHDGATVTFRARGREHTSTVSEDGTAVTLESVQGAVTARYTYRLDPAGDGTRATLAADVVTRGALSLFAPLIRTMIRRTDGTQLEHLREAAEARGT